ncbi:MAG: hypothetical protein DRQ88_04215 [Epsilonproteobacteria bacterium]|nr:MAG: hypothetical protein DRQ89_00510 [Campylobacterota bacterium]RLA67105.1 MAG: hypothetical protein DRQ88_04215 [Campylobacterota bacterium]
MPKLILLLLLISCLTPADKVDSCDFPSIFLKYDTFLKHYNICQDPDDDSLIRFKLKEGDIHVKYCFIPTYIAKDSNKSIFIGEPRCLFIKDPKETYEITFIKNRPTPEGDIPYSNYPIKGVMIIKDQVMEFSVPFEAPLPAPNAYLKCAEALDLTGDDSYCRAFKEMGKYSFLAF